MIGVGPYASAPRLAAGRQNDQRADNARKDAMSASETSATQLTEEEQRIVAQLKARDREVRTHEQAHKAVGGRYAGTISYEFDRGPDGKQYAVGGEVPIDASPIEGDPKATIAKMEIVIAAALAPAEPSGEDRAVARQAQATRMEAVSELRAERRASPFSAGRSASVQQVLFERLEAAAQNDRDEPNNAGVTSGSAGEPSTALEAFRAYAERVGSGERRRSNLLEAYARTQDRSADTTPDPAQFAGPADGRRVRFIA